MFYRHHAGHHGLRRALLLGTATLFAAPAYAACDTTGTVDVIQCDITGVGIKVSGAAGSVTLDDFVVESGESDGYVRIFADDSIYSPTAITVTLSGNTVITTYDYLGMDVRTNVGDITIDVGADVEISAQQTGIYVESGFDSEGDKYDGGEIVLTNAGTITAGPDSDPMGANGIAAVSNGGGVSVTNTGTVTTTYGTRGETAARGIVADGGNMAVDEVMVSIYNSGTVDALDDGLRVNSYNGLGRIVNDVNGVVTSHDRRGVALWSAANSAEFENYGQVTALDGTGAMVWAEGTEVGDASVINGGTITAYDDANYAVTDSLFNGVHIWSEVVGDASLVNLSSGRIIAEDDWAAWLLSTDGNVEIDNAGLLKGKSTAILVGADQIYETTNVALDDYEGAMHGDLIVNNSGLVTAFETVGTFSNFGLVTLAGGDIGTLELNNLAGGLIGAGYDFSGGFDAGVLDSWSAAELDDLGAAASNYAVTIGAEADSISIDNRGTLFGAVTVLTPDLLYGEGPDSTGAIEVSNSGLWVTRGVSFLTDAADSATFRNSGTTWALGTAEFWGDYANQGGLVVVAATEDLAASLAFRSDFDATGDSRLAFDLGAGSALNVHPIVAVAGNVTGQTDLVLKDISGWDWKAGGWLDLVTVDGSTEFGEESFFLSRPVQGLIEFQLAYEDHTQTWSVGQAEVSEQSLEEVSNVTGATQSAVASTSSGILNRTDDLRNEFWSDTPVTPLGYTEAPRTVADEAFAALTPVPSQVRTWIKATGAFGAGDGYDSRLGVVDLGADVGTTLDGTFVALGAFGSLSTARVDFESSDSAADIAGTAAGVYGTLMTSEGFYVSGTVMVEASAIDLLLSGETADIDALTAGARLDAGYRTEVAGFGFEPGVGVRVGATQYSDFTMSSSEVSLGDTSSLAAELRLRLDRQLTLDTVLLTPFAVFTLGAEADDDGSSVAVSDLGTYELAGDGGGYAGVAAGLSVTGLDGALTGYARGDLTLTEDAYQAGLKLGASYRF